LSSLGCAESSVRPARNAKFGAVDNAWKCFFGTDLVAHGFLSENRDVRPLRRCFLALIGTVGSTDCIHSEEFGLPPVELQSGDITGASNWNSGATSPANSNDVGTQSGTDTTSGEDPSNYECFEMTTDQVYLYGTYFYAANDLAAIIAPAAPYVSCAGFTRLSLPGLLRPTDGRFIWIDYTNPPTLKVFNHENVWWDAGSKMWQYPADPVANDDSIPLVEGCAPQADLIANPETGEVFYDCGSRWYRQDGTEVLGGIGKVIVAAYADGSVLAYEDDSNDNRFVSTLQIIAVDGTSQFLTFAADEMRFSYVRGIGRHTAGGIWLVVIRDDILRRWKIEGTTAVEEGAFAELPSDAQQGYSGFRLDGEGDMWQVAGLAATAGISGIIRRPLAEAGSSEWMYSEADGPRDNWLSYEPAPLFIRVRSTTLITGP
jgi:hypothetical protein